jgi:hypothetical protein
LARRQSERLRDEY